MAYVGSTSYLSIRPYGLLAYTHYEFTGSRVKPHDTPRVKPQGYTGALSQFAKKKLKKAIGLLVAIALPKEATNFKTGKKFKFKINFITLTLPSAQGEITDKEIKHCLDNWIKRAKRKHGLKSYVWRAERQKNGNIHFHIITDTYIHYESVRNDWNDVLSPLGFIKAYQERNGNKIPNSTDVHSVNEVKDLTAYFLKYMSKQEGVKGTLKKIKSLHRLPPSYCKAIFKVPFTEKHNTVQFHKIQGKVWDCSVNLKSKDSCTIHMDALNTEAWQNVWDCGMFECLSTDTCAIIFLKEADWVHLKGTTWEHEWHSYLNRIRLAA